ncbi:hypothetical protein V6N11_002003 [Hibiscus sabdariffa]|uniref:ATPase AAA-type core domain-containing protein n=1 Tax=Hibiscus sabdariffa TaxID=183260 RepID=A0ABR2QU58_9ROSI
MMTRVVAQSALLTAPTHGHGHGHGLSKEIGKAKRSVKMAYMKKPSSRAIMLARDESRRLGEDSIDADHILLRLADTGIAAEALKSMGIKFRDVREYVIKKIISISLRRTTGLCFEFTSIATDILILSFEEAHKLVSRLIGSHPGYSKGGQLTEVVWRRPYSVVIFDGIYSSPDILNMIPEN